PALRSPDARGRRHAEDRSPERSVPPHNTRAGSRDAGAARVTISITGYSGPAIPSMGSPAFFASLLTRRSFGGFVWVQQQPMQPLTEGTMRNGKKRAADDEVALMSEIASALGVHRTTAYHMARAGEIAGVSWRGGRYEMSRP